MKCYSENPALAGEAEARTWGFADGDAISREGMHGGGGRRLGTRRGARDLGGPRDPGLLPAPGGLHHAMAKPGERHVHRQRRRRGDPRAAEAGRRADRLHRRRCAESGRYLYPGSGSLAERGLGAGEGTALNVPLPHTRATSRTYRRFETVIAPAVRRSRPEIVVSMTGVDPHHTDPMAHLQVTTAAFARFDTAMRDLAFDAPKGRWLVLTAGGYNIDLLGGLWAGMALTRSSAATRPARRPSSRFRGACGVYCASRETPYRVND